MIIVWKLLNVQPLETHIGMRTMLKSFNNSDDTIGFGISQMTWAKFYCFAGPALGRGHRYPSLLWNISCVGHSFNNVKRGSDISERLFPASSSAYRYLNGPEWNSIMFRLSILYICVREYHYSMDRDWSIDRSRSIDRSCGTSVEYFWLFTEFRHWLCHGQWK